MSWFVFFLRSDPGVITEDNVAFHESKYQCDSLTDPLFDFAAMILSCIHFVIVLNVSYTNLHAQNTATFVDIAWPDLITTAPGLMAVFLFTLF